jgi:hypothetical protein
MREESMNFKEQLDRKRQAAKAAPQRKSVAEMSEAELDRELQRAHAKLQEAKRREIDAAREAAAETGTRPRFLAGKTRRKHWR